MNILKNFSNYIDNMEQGKKPIIKLSNDKIKISKIGLKLLAYYHQRMKKSIKQTKNHEKINLDSSGKILWASGKPEKEDTKSILAKKEAFYQKFYSNFYDSYTITINRELLRKIE